MGATAIHLQDKDAGAKVRKLHELFIDIGAKDQASAMARLNIGDAGVFLDSSMMMTEELIVARALDNRIGTFVAAETLRLIHEQKDQLKVRVVAVSTVQEEVGLHGASMIAESVRPDIALVTDVGHATDSPGISHAQHGHYKMGEGPLYPFWIPYHLVHFEAPLAIARVVLLRDEVAPLNLPDLRVSLELSALGYVPARRYGRRHVVTHLVAGSLNVPRRQQREHPDQKIEHPRIRGGG